MEIPLNPELSSFFSDNKQSHSVSPEADIVLQNTHPMWELHLLHLVIESPPPPFRPAAHWKSRRPGGKRRWGYFTKHGDGGWRPLQ